MFAATLHMGIDARLFGGVAASQRYAGSVFIDEQELVGHDESLDIGVGRRFILDASLHYRSQRAEVQSVALVGIGVVVAKLHRIC